jgi:hypothetical protein
MDINKSTSSTQLLRLCKKLGIQGVKIMSKDEITPDFVGKAIINLDKMRGNGTHWTALIWDGEEGEYFDSYGMYPPKKVEEMADNGVLNFSTRCLQALGDQSCGYYCVAFLLSMDRGMRYTEFLDKFHSKTEVERRNNNHILRSFFNI